MKYIKQFISTLAIGLCLITNPALASDFDTARKAYFDGDHETAFALFSPLAEQGDALAQFNLGNMYQNGRGTLKNGDEAFRWYKKAAAQGLAEAQFHLAKQYGLRGDYIKAHQWLNIAQFKGADSAELIEALEEIMSQADIRTAENKAKVCLESG
jgi:TPR repeat protein